MSYIEINRHLKIKCQEFNELHIGFTIRIGKKKNSELLILVIMLIKITSPLKLSINRFNGS